MVRLPLLFAAGLFLGLWSAAFADETNETKADPSRVTEAGKLPADARLGKARDTNDAYHPWTPPTSKESWEREVRKIRERILVSNGLWPMPAKGPLEPVVHGRVDKGDYTVEKVYFQSMPGHYVTGSLYRPNPLKEKHAAVLCPHGHWANGRFYDANQSAGDYAAAKQLEVGGEVSKNAAGYPLQARMAQLARLGCVVFHYDMVGNADSTAIAHRAGFTDAEAALRLQNFVGLQTWNSIRALDFVTSLPEVDATRIGVTGASGGGTQTFLLCAIDPRPAAAFPAVMVSTGMQGGCICENAEYMRVGLNNIAFAAAFAPRPLAMSGADDWTIEIETKGLPELKQVYALYGRPDLVHAKTWKEFKHNYNLHSRELMYNWFNEHLKLGVESPVKEREFEPIPPKELSVWDEEHPKPADFLDAAGVRKAMTVESERLYAELLPTTAEKLAEYKRVVGTAARVMLDDGVPAPEDLVSSFSSTPLGDGLILVKGMIGRKGAGEQVPFAVVVPPNFGGTVLLSAYAGGKRQMFGDDGLPTGGLRKVLQQGVAVAGVDVFLTGEFVEDGKSPAYPKVQENYQGYTTGFNRTVLGNRVRDLLTAVAAARSLKDAKRVILVGIREAAPWALLARSIAGDQIDDALIIASDFRFASDMSVQDPNFLPGALKYGGLWGIAATAAPAKTMVIGLNDVPPRDRRAFEAAYRHSPGALTVVDSLESFLVDRISERLK